MAFQDVSEIDTIAEALNASIEKEQELTGKLKELNKMAEDGVEGQCSTDTIWYVLTKHSSFLLLRNKRHKRQLTRKNHDRLIFELSR